MGFSKEVKNKMLVAAARHCCVCHRYNSVGVEIHHIVQEADGGPNSYENAIALCFDCHAAAGHYNLRHPRGTKYSVEELRLARETWIEIVRKNEINLASGNADLLSRYFVCKNFEFLKNISSLQLSDFPVAQPVLYKNNVFHALVDLVTRHPESHRSSSLWGRKFESEETFLKVYQRPDKVGHHDDQYPYFTKTRLPTQAELISLKRRDGLVSAMVEHGISPEEAMAVVGCYEIGCGEGHEFQEEYLLRAMWGVFLAVENRSEEPITLSILQAKCANKAGFLAFSEVSAETTHLTLPQAPLLPGMTAIIPVAMLIPPLYPFKTEVISTDFPDGIGDCYRGVSHCLMEPGNAEKCLSYGGFVQPTTLLYRKSTHELRQNIHQFDLTNFYEIDMHWGCGSCPHLFYKFEDSQALKYERELLRPFEGRLGQETFVVPVGVFEIVIAELEDEVTDLATISINGKEIAKNVRLEKGDDLRVSVSSGDVVRLEGQYRLTCPENKDFPLGRVRNTLVFNYLAMRTSALRSRGATEPKWQVSTAAYAPKSITARD